MWHMRRIAAVVLVVTVVLSSFTGIASAQSQQRVSDKIVIQEGETVKGFTAYAGKVVIQGEVDGDITAFGGRVVIEETGRVNGRVRAFAGAVVVAGTIDGNAVAYGGHVDVAQTGTVRGSFGALGGSVFLGGTIRGDTTTVAASVTAAPTADIDGFLTYVGDFTDQGGSVSNGARHVSELSLLPSLTGAGGIMFALYLLLADIFAGVLLLYAFPGFGAAAVRTAYERPQRLGLAGVAAVVAIPAGALLATLTVVGIPLALAGLAVYVVLLWLGSIYGRYLLGVGLLSYTEKDNRMLALATGVVLVAVLSLIPVVGNLLRGALTVMGVGAITLGLSTVYLAGRDRAEQRSLETT